MTNDTIFPVAKRCTKCGEIKPLTLFSKGSGKDGLQGSCKSCVSAYNHVNKEAIMAQKREYRASLASRDHIEIPSEKLCSTCQIIKPCFEFNSVRDTLDGLRSQCKTCSSVHRLTTRETRNHRNKEREIALKSRSHINVPLEKRCARCHLIKTSDEFYPNRRTLSGLNAYCKSCHADIREMRREETREYMRKRIRSNPAFNRQRALLWAKLNPDKVAAKSHRRKALLLRNGGGLTYAQISELRKQQAGICAYCGQLAKLSIDHVIPVTQGGPNDISNVVLCCRQCNSSKNNRTPEQWIHRWYLHN